MKPFIEKEYKMMITKDEYEFFLKNLPLDTHIQVNHYYSSNNPNIAIRTRIIDEKIIFTLKERGSDYRKEYEFEIEENNLNDQRIQDLLKEFNIDKTVYEGIMTTTRSTLELKYGEFCLDKSEYLGKVDFEIEYELYDATIDNKEEFLEILNKANLSYKKSYNSKYGRFKEAKMKVGILLAPGVEECEALGTYDVLFRAGIDVELIGLESEIISSHKIKIEPNTTIDKVKDNLYDCLVLPGGIPGTPNLEANEDVQKMIDNHINADKYVAAICAAPSILNHKGLLKDSDFTCAPNFECGLNSTKEKAHISGKIITGVGLGGVFDFAGLIVEKLVSKEKADEVLKKFCYR